MWILAAQVYRFWKDVAPTVLRSCVRLLSAIACEFDLAMCVNFMYNKLFFNPISMRTLFLRLPKGCGSLSGKIVVLNKSVYGSKQASRLWHAHLTSCLKTLGF